MFYLLLADVIIIVVVVLTAPDVIYVANYENKKPQKRNHFDFGHYLAKAFSANPAQLIWIWGLIYKACVHGLPVMATC